MELIKKIYLTCASESNSGVTKGKIDLISTFNKIENLLILFVIKKGQFLKEAQQFSPITPLEVNILFSMIKGFKNDE